MPSFEELKKSPAGQTIRVRAADGTVFLSHGPNYGRWLTLRETPQVMQDAMVAVERSEEHTSELQSLMRNSYAVFCLKKKHNYTKSEVISPTEIYMCVLF